MLTRHLLGLVVGIVGLGAAIAAFTHTGWGHEPDEASRGSVRFHEALRTRATTIAPMAWEEDAVAQRLANELLEVRELEPDIELLTAFGAPASSIDEERTALLLAMVVSRAKSSLELPAEIVLYEAERISLGAIDAELRPLVEGARVYAQAEADRCEQLSDPEARVSHPLLDGIRALLIDGAHGCCALRRGDWDTARDRIARSADDAERLHVAIDRVALLRAWVHFSRDEVDAARAELDRVAVDELGETDMMRYSMLRNAVTLGEDTLLSVVEPRWFSSIVVEGISEAIGNDAELAARIEESPRAQAALDFVRMEARLLRHARDLHPLLDHRPR